MAIESPRLPLLTAKSAAPQIPNSLPALLPCNVSFSLLRSRASPHWVIPRPPSQSWRPAPTYLLARPAPSCCSPTGAMSALTQTSTATRRLAQVTARTRARSPSQLPVAMLQSIGSSLSGFGPTAPPKPSCAASQNLRVGPTPLLKPPKMPATHSPNSSCN